MLITVLPQAGCGQFEQTQVLWQLSHHHPPASLMHKVISNWKKTNQLVVIPFLRDTPITDEDNHILGV